MSNRWPGKYVIGLTGNIATGKSVVRKMLEHLGVFGLDADALAHQAIAKGGPAYAPVLKIFGDWLLTETGEIDRARLGKLVFTDPEALAKLEAVIHPLVSQALDFLIKRSQSKVVVVEAIKLIESGIAKDCDALWVVNAPEAVQVARLVEKRKLTEAQAKERIAAQPPQADKVKAAAVIIQNTGSFDDIWSQVQAAFSIITQPATPGSADAPTVRIKPLTAETKNVKVRRGKPTDAATIAAFIKQTTNGQRDLTRADIMAAFGQKAYLLADCDGELAAIAGWQVENLVTRVDEFYASPTSPLDQLAPPLIEAVENASKELQSEAALVFIPLPLAQAAAQALSGSGFVPQTAGKLGVAAWEEAVKESMPPGTAMLFKKLREDRVLRPV
jgi:dephospho-CoA kinase